MKTRIIFVLAFPLALTLALAACSTTSSAVTHQAATSKPAVLAPDANAGRICAAVNALEYQGNTVSSAEQTAATALRVSVAQAVTDIRAQCPKEAQS